MRIKRDEASRVVCELKTTNREENRLSIGTGIFVNTPSIDGRFLGWIVTANHVAQRTNEQTEIVIAMEDGTPQSFPLTLFGDISNWRHHQTADVSAFQIEFTEQNTIFLQNRFFPCDHFNLEPNPVSRDFELTTVGFPLDLGVGEEFSPLTFRTHAASSFFKYPRSDTKQPSTFFCLENPSVGGYSGCPVFDLGYYTNGIVAMTKEKTICYGIMHGTIGDETGGKMALVTPSHYLKDLILW